ncbi:uncharacterized protein LOC134751406 isoform X2 [Cydia strobilella]|uniref:uncharacterized protein LOC134751406 isoform X2 n=1 Tax=Cydia strobilella TaxID=1100964 RepID=UPI003007494D
MPPSKKYKPCQYKTCQICRVRSVTISDNCKKRIFMSRFPLDEDRCRQWVKLVGKEDLAYVPIEKLHELKYLCADHFKNRDFNNKKNRLKRSAIPSRNFNADPLPDDMLVDFPSHVFSDISRYVKNHASSVICVKRVSQSQVEAIAESCNSGTTGTNKTSTEPVPKLQQADVHLDHLYCKKETLQTPVEVQPATNDGSSKLDSDVETDEQIETDEDAFDNDSPPSPVPEIGNTHENIFSWQRTELIEADAPEAPTPVSEKLKLADDVVTLSLFCDDDPPIQSEPIAAVLEDVTVRCKDCTAVIDGFSFWCVQCLRGALCVACAASETHYAHYVLRSPKGATQNKTQAVLAVIRQQLVMENLLTLYETDGEGVKVEVKHEPEEPAPASPDPLAVGPHPDSQDTMEMEPYPYSQDTLEVEPYPDTTVKNKRVDEETDHQTVKRLRLNPRTRKPNSTVKMKADFQQKLLKVPANVLRRYQTDHTLYPGILRAPDIRASQQKHDALNVRRSQKVHILTLTPSDLISRGIELVTSSKITESQVLSPTASNFRRSRSLNVPIRGSETVQALTGDLKSQGVIQATTSNSRVSQDVRGRPMRDPSEMLRTVTSEAAVQLQPLTAEDIRKWSADRKRRRND